MSKILLIEDDPAILLGLEELFKLENYEVISVSDGKEGLFEALNSNPSIVVLDINLPSLNGLDICRKLRENKFSEPIIILTARTEQIDKIVGLELGADDYLTKPFNSRELLARVRTQLRRVENDKPTIDQKGPGDSYRRKLLSIMFTDMKDYSKRMNLNENKAINTLKKHNKIMNDSIQNYIGNIVETIGDGYLVSFESAVNAVNCAYTIQSKFIIYNKHKSAEEKIEIRIGVHLGDVVEFEKKLKGDTLNIAARIQQNTPPGKIYISRSVYEAIKNKVNYKILEIGYRELKNIKDPIFIYDVTK